MKKSIFLIALLAYTFPALPQKTTANVSAQNPTSAEQEVWSLEETDWQLRKAGNNERYLKSRDERFVGWPAMFPLVAHKDDLRKVLSRKLVGYKLEPLSVRQYNPEIVITFYRATLRTTDTNGKNEQIALRRVTHTWIKEKVGWRIVGGMSSSECATSQ